MKNILYTWFALITLNSKLIKEDSYIKVIFWRELNGERKQMEMLALIPEFDETTKLRVSLNTEINELADAKYYFQLESEAKGLGDLHRRDLAETIVYLLKQVIGTKELQILKEFEAYNDRKMKEYFESKANENNN